MSSYPYLDEPELPGSLTVEDMLAALSIILLRPRWLGHPEPMSRVDATVAEKHAHKFRALLFRSMRLPQYPIAKDNEMLRRRNEQDDEDLRQVHLLLTRNRRYHSQKCPTKLKSGPPIIALQDLPSSNSTNLTGSVPRNEFESLYRICSCLEAGGQVVEAKEEINCPSKDIEWEEFNAIIASAPIVSLDRLPTHLVSEIGNQSSFIRGMTLLFLPFVSPVVGSGTFGQHNEGKEKTHIGNEDIGQIQ